MISTNPGVNGNPISTIPVSPGIGRLIHGDKAQSQESFEWHES